MKPDDIKIADWMRWLVGEVPGSFYIELVIRAAVIYLLLMVCMRLLGKRMSSQLGRNDMVAMVTLAATIGIPLQAPDRGLLPAIVIAVIVVLTGRWVSKKAFYSESFEKLSQGNISILVKNAVMDLTEMKKARLTRERLVAQLRFAGIKHLGQVKRLYMEANGAFTVIEEEEPQTGLFIIPRDDSEMYDRFYKSDTIVSCENCGFSQDKKSVEKNVSCPSCGHEVWTTAVSIKQN
ncbi:DUF421 domain-containing protein [Mucilaginibacter pallidiroseus]|uniref:DUF421 domain-containing protein n=1 Tax=Mucilaginibacter pallidiroseus TaxID=2599295 RepID=A0A563UI07_9SPHI|nr:YetF domain-containing protein [Mucilaginibacter pallidiroseus]TWR30923.1 DUF421 domain-containing protein [Mucilaginibacter pallidiroseus]